MTPGGKYANVETAMGSESDRSTDMMPAGAVAKLVLRLLICTAAVFLVTAVFSTVSLRDRPLFPLLIFLFLVSIVSSFWGFRYALFVSLLAALGFSWLRPPVGSFWLSDWRDIVALTVFLVIGITTSHLSDRARREALNAKLAEEALRNSEERWRSVFENSAIGVALTELNGRFLVTNHVFQAMVDYTGEELRALTFIDLTHEYYLQANLSLIAELVEGKRRQFQIEKKYRRKDGSLIWVSVNVSLVPGTERVPRFLMVLSEDITERKRAEALLTGEKRILEMVARGDPLPQILDGVCRFVEEQASGFLASILLVDDNRLRHGGAPSLPKAYTDAIDGALIGPSAGSCGTAAYRGEQVIVEDIATDPLWADYREAALPHSLRACWSTPVFSSQRKLIATFALYYREPRSPSPSDQETIEQISHLVGVAIERKLTQEALRASEHNLSLIINTIPAL